MILYDSFEKSGKSMHKTKKLGMGSDVARTTWKQWKWREDEGRLQTTSFVLRITEPENGLPVRRPRVSRSGAIIWVDWDNRDDPDDHMETRL